MADMSACPWMKRKCPVLLDTLSVLDIIWGMSLYVTLRGCISHNRDYTEWNEMSEEKDGGQWNCCIISWTKHGGKDEPWVTKYQLNTKRTMTDGHFFRRLWIFPACGQNRDCWEKVVCPKPDLTCTFTLKGSAASEWTLTVRSEGKNSKKLF